MATEIPHDLPCVTCGYDLRGLRENGACPECGTAIERSMRGDLLSAADPAWLRTIARGQRMIGNGLNIAAICLVSVIGLLIVFLIVTASFPTLPRVVENVTTGVVGFLLIVGFVAICVSAVGVFLVTKQEGRLSEHESAWSARNLARWSAPASVGVVAALLAVRSLSMTGTAALAIDAALRLVVIGLLTAAVVSLLAHLESLLRRIPDGALVTELEKERRFLRWGVPAAGLYLLMGPMLLQSGMRGPGGAVLGLLGGGIVCVGFVALLGLIVTTVRLVGMMRRCADRFQFCLAIAEQT